MLTLRLYGIQGLFKSFSWLKGSELFNLLKDSIQTELLEDCHSIRSIIPLRQTFDSTLSLHGKSTFSVTLMIYSGLQKNSFFLAVYEAKWGLFKLK